MHRILFAAIALGLAGPAEAQVAQTPPVIVREANWFVRQDENGKIVWATPLDGPVGGVRPPHLVQDEKRCYVAHNSGVTALDLASGRTGWRINGIHDGLLVQHGLLVGTGYDGKSHCLFGCDVDKGTLAFKVVLPGGLEDPAAVGEMGGLFVVQGGFGRGPAVLVDRTGKVRHRFKGHVAAGKRVGDDMVFLTGNAVVRLTAADRTIWTFPFGGFRAGGLLSLPDGDLIAFQYGPINDSGVEVVRLDSSTGKSKWSVHCSGLHWHPHSEYEHHAFVAVERDRVHVTSKGSHGTFIEILDLAGGRRIFRTQYP